ncbi:MAG TPA: double-strand break repair helicase AddA [Xanthobacteraceae bacterium]|nr:double-strand break repair helicase AddA [Xanthobacteraceae bacterium]
MTRRPIPETTRQAQFAVSDPAASAWVSANAGSGKTYVLAQRVIRLLLRGTPPGRILCLTFTKAAAAHMANQVLKTLRSWVALDDAMLDERIVAIDGGKPSAARRAEARRLFATALETPGGLKVQTIHAFCDRVLHQFPFEAGVPAGFTVLEESLEADLLQRARADVLLEAARAPESELGRALALAVSTDSDTRLADLFDEMVRARRKLHYLLGEEGLERAERAICDGLGLAHGDSVAAAEAEILSGPFLPHSEWKAIADQLMTLKGNPKSRGEQLAKAAATSDSQIIDSYLSIFCTQKGTLRELKGFGGEDVRDTEPAVQRLIAELGRIAPLIERRRAAQAFERTCALNRLGRAIIQRYEAMKQARGALDYDDLVSKTADLLEDQAAAWVHYKLDGGIDHILIDEAQDTSPEQWKVVAQLAKEFFAGEGASERPRTIFAVGDEKQSIFGFQGADPKSFEEMQRNFRKQIEGAKQKFEPRQLDLSFRSAAGIVGAVDQVFSTPESFRGLSNKAGETHTIHTAIRSDAPALVEIWDAVPAPKSESDELGWDAPLDAERPSSAPLMLAQKIAKAVRSWLDKPQILIGDPETETPRPPNAGDIIVLVRSRGTLFDAILRELKQAGVPVAGADRMQLAEHIAVMDIAALCDALLLPSDDLALACALKSPLLGFSEDELYEIAYGRSGTLADALAAANSAKCREAAEKLARWRDDARALRPFDFLSRVLSRDRGRAQILARLGLEAADALDELLAHALAYEATETPSLAGFLVFLRRGGSQVKRDLEVESDAVRVMTVHGVKGLEAPIVLLADTASPPDSKRHHPKLMPLPDGPFVWASGDDSKAIARAREMVVQANEGEHRRLLYVALTRARDAIVVAAAENRGRIPEGSWYRLVRGALEGTGGDFVEIEDHGYGFSEKVFRWRYQPAQVPPQRALSKPETIAEPDWLRRPIAGISSRAPAAPRKDGESSTARAEARRRGVLIHRLLQELPRFPAEREKRARQYLANAAANLPEATRETIANEALKVLAHPELAALFGAESRAEAAIAGRWNEGEKTFAELGRVDRFAVTAGEVLIADFKSDAAPPGEVTGIPFAYLTQLARYRAVLARIYPSKAMRAFVVWTANGAVHEIPKALLDKAFAHLTGS